MISKQNIEILAKNNQANMDTENADFVFFFVRHATEVKEYVDFYKGYFQWQESERGEFNKLWEMVQQSVTGIKNKDILDIYEKCADDFKTREEWHEMFNRIKALLKAHNLSHVEVSFLILLKHAVNAKSFLFVRRQAYDLMGVQFNVVLDKLLRQDGMTKYTSMELEAWFINLCRAAGVPING